MLTVSNLHAEIGPKKILKGINFKVMPGEVHAIMGPNGSGKSTFSKAIIGHPSLSITEGEITWKYNGKNRNLLEIETYERALMGIFLGHQYPLEIPGISNFSFLHESFNENCLYQGAKTLSAEEFRLLLIPKLKELEMKEQFLDRSLNAGFSGGEKKKNEILQLNVLNPKLAFLDETDSGLDIDALKIVSHGVNQFKNKFNAVVMVTHYQRLLDYIVPDQVHVLYLGKIIKSGDKDLALYLEKNGYDQIIKESL